MEQFVCGILTQVNTYEHSEGMEILSRSRVWLFHPMGLYWQVRTRLVKSFSGKSIKDKSLLHLQIAYYRLPTDRPPKPRHCFQTIRIRSTLKRGYRINSLSLQTFASLSMPSMENSCGHWISGISLWDTMTPEVVRRIGMAEMHWVNLWRAASTFIHLPQATLPRPDGCSF